MEALTLPHEDGSLESACNLLNWHIEGPEYVLERAQAKAAELQIEIVKSYTTGPSEQELLARYYHATR